MTKIGRLIQKSKSGSKIQKKPPFRTVHFQGVTLIGLRGQGYSSSPWKECWLVVENVHHLPVDIVVKFRRSVLDCDVAAHRLSLRLGKTVTENVDIPALNVEFQGMNPVSVTLVALPRVVVVERNGAKAAYLHDLFECSAIRLLVEVHVLSVSLHGKK